MVELIPKNDVFEDVLAIDKGMKFVKTKDFAIVDKYPTHKLNLKIIQRMYNLGYAMISENMFFYTFKKRKK